MKIELRPLDPRVTELSRATPEAAAVDLRACNIGGHKERALGDGDRVTLAPGERIKVGTGLAIDLGAVRFDEAVMPQGSQIGMENFFGFHGYAALAIPRSGLGSKGVILGNLVGLIDSDYQGEILLSLWNAGDEEFCIKAFERLAQLVVIPVARPDFHLVPEFSRLTERGANGFGSTGVK